MKRHVIFSSCSFLIYSYSRHLLHPFPCMSYHSQIKDENRFHRELDFTKKTDVWLETSRDQCNARVRNFASFIRLSRHHLIWKCMKFPWVHLVFLRWFLRLMSTQSTLPDVVSLKVHLICVLPLTCLEEGKLISYLFLFPSSSLLFFCLNQSFGDFLVVSHSFSPSFFSNPFVF